MMDSIARRQIAQLWKKAGLATLVTLVRAEGSSYRRPGARLLAAANGVHAGTISGGCLEAEVLRKAAWMVRNGAVVERYSTLFDDTAEVPYGLGCGGIVDLLLEPVDTPECRALLEAIEGSLRGEPAMVVTWLPNPAANKRLRRAIFNSAGKILFSSPDLSGEKLTCAQSLDPAGEYTGRFVEQLLPPQRLIVLGAGRRRAAVGSEWPARCSAGGRPLPTAARSSCELRSLPRGRAGPSAHRRDGRSHPRLCGSHRQTQSC